MLTGITKNAFPAAITRTSATAREDSDTELLTGLSASDAAEDIVGASLSFQFTRDVDDAANMRVLRRAADVIWREQSVRTAMQRYPVK